MTDPITELEPYLRLYLSRGWLVLPCDWRPGSRKPLFAGGFRLASRDPDVVRTWWRRTPRALVAIATGKRPQGSGIAIVDVDPEHDGFATLARLIGPELPPVPRVHTPSGGLHLYFQCPRRGSFSTDGIGGKYRRGLGPGLDFKCDLRQCHAPGGSPSSPYRWDDEFNLVTIPALPPLPAVLTPVEIPEEEVETPPRERQPGISDPLAYTQAAIARYAQAAITRACERIRTAVPGGQRRRLNGEALSMGRLAAGLNLDHQPIINALVEAGMKMQQEAGKPPWHRHEVRKTVLDGFRDGLKRPKVPQLKGRR